MTSDAEFTGFLASAAMPGMGTELSKGTGVLFTEILLIIGIGLAIFTVLALGAKFLRKKKRKRASSDRSHRAKSSSTSGSHDAGGDDSDEDSPSGGHRRRRHRRRAHRTRNPTLAETGGLPPVKSEDSGTII